MTSALLRKRLEKLTPPPPSLNSYIAPTPDPATLANMRAYLNNYPLSLPGVSAEVYEAMTNYLAGQ